MQELRTEPRQRRSQQSIDAILDAAERLIHDARSGQLHRHRARARRRHVDRPCLLLVPRHPRRGHRARRTQRAAHGRRCSPPPSPASSTATTPIWCSAWSARCATTSTRTRRPWRWPHRRRRTARANRCNSAWWRWSSQVVRDRVPGRARRRGGTGVAHGRRHHARHAARLHASRWPQGAAAARSWCTCCRPGSTRATRRPTTPAWNDPTLAHPAVAPPAPRLHRVRTAWLGARPVARRRRVSLQRGARAPAG